MATLSPLTRITLGRLNQGTSPMVARASLGLLLVVGVAPGEPDAEIAVIWDMNYCPTVWSAGEYSTTWDQNLINVTWDSREIQVVWCERQHNVVWGSQDVRVTWGLNELTTVWRNT